MTQIHDIIHCTAFKTDTLPSAVEVTQSARFNQYNQFSTKILYYSLFTFSWLGLRVEAYVMVECSSQLTVCP